MDIENGLWFLGAMLAGWLMLEAHESRYAVVRVPARLMVLLACVAIPSLFVWWFVWVIVWGGNLR